MKNINLQYLDRIPRYASCLGILGLCGLAGIFHAELSRLSALSFLSFFCFFRFFRCFVDPLYGPRPASVPLLVWAMVISVLGLWATSLSPWFGFLGFAGYCGLCDLSGGSARQNGCE